MHGVSVTVRSVEMLWSNVSDACTLFCGHMVLLLHDEANDSLVGSKTMCRHQEHAISKRNRNRKAHAGRKRRRKSHSGNGDR